MKTITLCLLLTLTACATPVTQLKARDGSTITCGGSRAGSLSGGLVGYAINKSMDEECVKKAKAQGAR